jgi:starch synthase
VPLLKIANLAILPSHHEPLGMFQIESQYLQVPTLASRVGGIPETMEHHKTGLLVEDRIGNWIDALDWALANPLKMRNYGNNGKEFVIEKFSIKKNIDYLIYFIENYNHSN